MTPEEFKLFMVQQAEHFARVHGDCKDITAEQISEDSIEFRRHWSTDIKQINKDSEDEKHVE